MNQPTHIPVLGHLRGLAALAVCLLHFVLGDPRFLNEANPIRWIAGFGGLGVHVFFVISGFVIPYSLYLRSYHYSDAADFFARRLKRLEPPYFACIAVTLVLSSLGSISPGYQGKPFSVSVPQLLAHVAYLNAILNYEWVNMVFWTLAIEFQFYFFVAATFPLINHTKANIRLSTVIGITLLGLLGPTGPGAKHCPFLVHWLPLFAIGIATFQVYVGRLSRGGFSIALIPVLACSTFVDGPLPTAAGLVTAVLILTCAHKKLPRAFEPLTWVGTISYSLYLVHLPIGSRVINIVMRVSDSPVGRHLGLIIAFAASILSACIFWYLVERPSQKWSKGSACKATSGKIKVSVPVAVRAGQEDT